MEQWELELRQKLGESVEETVEAVPQTVHCDNKKRCDHHSVSPMVAFMLVVVVVLGATIAYVALYKKPPVPVAEGPPPIVITPKIPRVPPVDNSLKEEVKKLKAEIAALQKKVEEVNKLAVSNRIKIQVCGIAINENAVIYRNNHPRKDIITINRRWGLSACPKYVIMTPADKEFINSLPKMAYNGDAFDVLSEPNPEIPAVPELSLDKAFSRLQVLGLVVNENAVSHNSKGKAITITPQWGISDMPQHVNLDDEGRKFIESILD